MSLCIDVFIDLYIYPYALLFKYLSINACIYTSIFPAIYLSVYLFDLLSTHLASKLSMHPSICLSIYIIYPSILHLTQSDRQCNKVPRLESKLTFFQPAEDATMCPNLEVNVAYM